MSWPALLVVAIMLAVAAGLAAGWLLPMAGIESPLARYLCFGVAGAIIGLLFLRTKGAPRA